MKSAPKQLRLLVTAGPTREKIDPVRFISNYSTGNFGYEIAKEAKARGYEVTLISGPTHLEPPKGVAIRRIESAAELQKSVLNEARKNDCVVMAAAVSDWRPISVSRNKIKQKANVTIRMKSNQDILSILGSRKRGNILVGFALETENLYKNAWDKLKKKRLDMIVANKIAKHFVPFGNNKTSILILDKFGNKTSVSGKSKKYMAKIILDKISGFNI